MKAWHLACLAVLAYLALRSSSVPAPAIATVDPFGGYGTWQDWNQGPGGGLILGR